MVLLYDEPAHKIVVQPLVPSWLYGLRGSDDTWAELPLEGLSLLLVSESQSEKVSAIGPPPVLGFIFIHLIAQGAWAPH